MTVYEKLSKVHWKKNILPSSYSRTLLEQLKCSDLLFCDCDVIPAGNYMFKVNDKTVEQCVKYVQSVFVILVSLLFTLNIFHTLT